MHKLAATTMISPQSSHSCRLAHCSTEDVLLWQVDLDQYATQVELEGFSADEIVAARRKVFARDRVRYMASRHALRSVLASIVGGSPADLRICADAWGRPLLQDGGAIDFNLSHTNHLCLIGICRGLSIGVDIESICAATDIDQLARLHFSEAEFDEWSGSGSNRARDFLSRWTRKEACLKALGVGLAAQLRAIEAGCAPDSRSVVVALGDDRCEAVVHSVDVVGEAAAAIALTTRADAARARRYFPSP